MDLNERIKKDFGAIDNFKEHVKYTFIYIFFEFLNLYSLIYSLKIWR